MHAMGPDFSEEGSVRAEEAQRRGRLVLHTLPILLIPALTAAVAYLLVRLTGYLPTDGVVTARAGAAVSSIIVLAVFLTALVVLVRVGRPTVSALLLIGAWTLITTMASLRGGIYGMGPAFLIIPICAAGLLIDGVASISLAGLATVLVGTLAWLQIGGFYTPPQLTMPGVPAPAPPVSALPPPVFQAVVWTSLFWTVALLTSLLAGGLQRALEQSRGQSRALRALSDQLEARVAAQTAELAQRAAKAEALYEVSQALTSTLDLNQVLDLITEQAARLLGFDGAQVLLQGPDGGFAPLGVYPHGPAGDGAEVAGAANGQLAALEPVWREVGERREPRIVRLPACEPDGQGHEGATRPAPGVSGAALVLPMHFHNRVAGVLMLTNACGSGECGSDDLILGQGLADQAAVAIANAQLLNEAREAATLEERTRLARDIHDTLAQGLTGVVVQLGATQRALELAPEEAREHLALALRMARESLAEARRSVWNLRAAALERGDLAQALQALALRPLGAQLSVTFEQRGQPWPLSSMAESTLLRVCQEALLNVAKHAQATEARIVLEYRPDRLELSIRDNGVGFDGPMLHDEAAALQGPWGGFGLVGMRERLSALGGALQIGDDDGGGAQVVAVIPRAADAPAMAGTREAAA